MIKLDILDKKILYILLNNGRAEYAKIGKQTGASLEKVKYRINRLVKKGIILGFRTILNYEIIGYSQHTILLKLRSMNNQIRKNAEEILKRSPFTLWVGTCIGPYHFRINVVAKNSKHLKEVIETIDTALNYQIKDYKILSRVHKQLGKNYLVFSYLSTEEEIKQLNQLQLPTVNHKKKDISILDKMDWKILKILSTNPRTTFREIGKILNVTGEDIKYRFDKINSTYIIRNFSISMDFTKIGLIWWAIFLRITNKEEEKKLISHIINHAQTTNLIRCIGDWDIEATFFSRQIGDADSYLLELSHRFEENILDSLILITNDSLKHPQIAEGVFEEIENKK